MDSDELRVSQIANDLHANIQEQLSNIQVASSSLDSKSLLADLHLFQPCPQLLDQHLDKYIDSLLKSYFDDSLEIDRLIVSEVFYTFGKIISVKRLLSYMKTDIDLIPVIIAKFGTSPESANLHWHEEYLLMCCLIVLTLVPFDLSNLGDVKNSVYNIGIFRVNESNAGPLQPLGARIIGFIITRSDCTDLLDRFIEELFTKYELAPDTVKCGYLQSLNISLQKDSNDLKLINNIPQIYDFLIQVQDEYGDSKLEYLLKIYSKLGKYFTRLDDVDKIDEIIEFFDTRFNSKSTLIRSSLAKNFTKLITRIDECTALDMMIDMIYSTKEQLGHAMELVDANLLHTQLLTIAEMLDKDLIDTIGVKQIDFILSRTLFFQQLQVTHISGSNIRDSSNYIIWALARTTLEIEPDNFLEIFINSLLCCCFDKDLTIRRSSTAALQELIGRHGFKNWDLIYPEDHGVVNSRKNVDLLEALDFVELSSTEKSFLSIPSKILKVFPQLKDRFTDFLAENVLANLDHEIVQLSSKALKSLLEESNDQKKIERQVILFTSHLYIRPYNSFIGLSETLPLLEPSSLSHYLPQIYEVFNSQRIDHHKTQPFVIESYLQISYTILLLDQNSIEFQNDIFLENLFDLIRVESSSILVKLKAIVPLLKLTPEYLKKWLYYTKNNTLNTASTISSLVDFESVSDEVIGFLKEDTNINSDVKTEIINSIFEFLQSDEENLSVELLFKLAEKLNDYTISEQGDVGSKIRNATIALIDKNFSLFEEIDGLKKSIEVKLLRLASEPIDSVRVNAFKLLLRFQPNTSILETDLETRDEGTYFTNVLKFFQENYISDKESSLEFWRGYVFSGGAIHSTNDQITSCLRSFLKFYSDLSTDSQTDVLLKLASIIRLDPQELSKHGSTRQKKLSKTVLVGLQFIARIFQLNVSIPSNFNIQGFYIRIYNIHLNTTNLTKLSNAIKIFGYLYIVAKHEESLKRLSWICCNHSISKVRVWASEELFTIYKELQTSNETDYEPALNLLAEVDWNENRDVLKKHLAVIYRP